MRATTTKWLTIGLISALLMGCGGNSSPSQNGESQASVSVFGSKALLLSDRLELNLTDDSISGSGQIVFDQPLEGINSSSAFLLNLQIEEGGFLEIHTYASSQLRGGIVLRIEEEDEDWLFTLEREERKIRVGSLSGGLSGLVRPDSQEIQLGLEVHHQETPAHILLWNPLSEDQFVFDSIDFTSPGNGTGTFWGIHFHRAKILKAERTSLRYEHDH